MSNSISQNLVKLSTDKTNIQTALVNKGITAASTHGFDDFADDIASIHDNLIEKSISVNGTYDPTDDNVDGYSSVTVNVPNTYIQADEGKVVQSGSLVAQTSMPTEITENDIYDTTLYNSVTVNVPNVVHTPISSGTILYGCKPMPVSKKNMIICRSWESITWNQPYFTGNMIWTDNTDIYYCNTGTSVGNVPGYRLNKDTGNWESVQFTGLPSTTCSPGNLWNDGEDVYYTYTAGYASYATYKLNKSDRSWSNIYFTNQPQYNFVPEYFWSDGLNIYYSNTHKFVKDSNSWVEETFTVPSGFTGFKGEFVWTDGNHIYYSERRTEYVYSQTVYRNYHMILNGSTWSNITWNGLTDFNGTDIWTDGDNIYCGNYILDITTRTWIPVGDGTIIKGSSFIWSDGTNVYYSPSYSSGTTPTGHKILKFYNSQQQTTNKNFPYMYKGNNGN